jgi:lysozyme
MSFLSKLFELLSKAKVPETVVLKPEGTTNKLIVLLKKHEGVMLKAYKDSVGKLTIGVGRNLDDVGISGDEAEYLLKNDIDRCLYDLKTHLPWYLNLSENRQIVMIDMCFNLGIGGLLEFKNTLASIQSGDYQKASEQMLQSKWATQVGNRATELSEMMKEG